MFSPASLTAPIIEARARHKRCRPRQMASRRDTVEGWNRRISCLHRTYSSRCGRRGRQRIQAALGAPGQEAAQIGFGVIAGRMPGVPLIAAARGRPWGIPGLMVQMGAAHAELHRLGSPPADARPGKVPDSWLRLARRLTESGGSGSWPPRCGR